MVWYALIVERTSCNKDGTSWQQIEPPFWDKFVEHCSNWWYSATLGLVLQLLIKDRAFGQSLVSPLVFSSESI